MSDARISIAVAALGGQGGGVLSNWIVDLAEANGYVAQYTAIAGVAQRTGATIYAIELFPMDLISKEGKSPVLALMPVAGDVDICLASELMEAGRAVNRGIVTPDKTTLIASNHRIYAIGEKEQMGDGRLDSTAVSDAIEKAAKKLVLFDMEEAVLKSSSVISSVMFGALAGSGALPFNQDAFKNTIRKSGRAVESNLAGFELGYKSAVVEKAMPELSCGVEASHIPSRHGDRISAFPEQTRDIITYGVHRLVDYQDGDYAHLYLDRLAGFKDHDLINEVARHLALWMGFEDVIRVADLKTRAERSEKISSEIRADQNQIWYGHDYFHPRYEELTDIMPRAIGDMMSKSNVCRAMFSPFFPSGRIIRPKTIFGYLLLRSVAKLRFLRRKTLRYALENKRILAWLELVAKYADQNPELAMEIATCPRLLKGYGDTHARGITRFSRIMAFIERNDDAANIVTKIVELKGAALLSEDGKEFNRLIDEGIKDNVPQEGELGWAGSS